MAVVLMVMMAGVVMTSFTARTTVQNTLQKWVVSFAQALMTQLSHHAMSLRIVKVPNSLVARVTILLIVEENATAARTKRAKVKIYAKLITDYSVLYRPTLRVCQ